MCLSGRRTLSEFTTASRSVRASRKVVAPRSVSWAPYRISSGFLQAGIGPVPGVGRVVSQQSQSCNASDDVMPRLGSAPRCCRLPVEEACCCLRCSLASSMKAAVCGPSCSERCSDVS